MTTLKYEKNGKEVVTGFLDSDTINAFSVEGDTISNGIRKVIRYSYSSSTEQTVDVPIPQDKPIVPLFKAHDHQMEVDEILTKLVRDKLYIDDVLQNKGIISLPCGSGKTYNEDLVLIKEKRAISGIVTSGLPLVTQHEKTLKSLAKEYGEEGNFDYIIIGSNMTYDTEKLDGELAMLEGRSTTDVGVIKAQIQESEANNRPLFFLASIKSLDKLGKALKALGKVADITVFDEAHKSTEKRVNKNLDFNHYPSKYNIFFTATPKTKHTNTDILLDYGMHKPELFGHILYSKTYKEMVDAGVILELIFLRANNKDEAVKSALKEINNVTDASWDDKFKRRLACWVVLLASVHKKTGLTKNISYMSNLVDAQTYVKYEKFLKKLLKSLIGDDADNIYFAYLDGNIFGDEREAVLHHYKKANNAILFNYKVIKEGIDIPSCNSSYWAQVMDAVNAHQSAGRPCRIDPNNKDKKFGYVLVGMFGDSAEVCDGFKAMENMIAEAYFGGFEECIIKLCRFSERGGGGGTGPQPPLPPLDVSMTIGEMRKHMKTIAVNERQMVKEVDDTKTTHDVSPLFKRKILK